MRCPPAGGDCDLVTPQSTVRGKGYWGDVEGFEALLNLSRAGDTFVNRPLNYRRVQVLCMWSWKCTSGRRALVQLTLVAPQVPTPCAGDIEGWRDFSLWVRRRR